MTNIHTSASINSLADLHAAIAKMMRLVPGNVDRDTITFVETLRLQLLEITLSDGSKVYDLRLFEE